MDIRVKTKDLGEVLVTTVDTPPKNAEYMIKSLAVLQLMCMNSKEDPEKFKELLRIIERTTKEIDELYDEEQVNAISTNEQF